MKKECFAIKENVVNKEWKKGKGDTDFETDKEKATQWAEEYFKHWQNSLGKEQKALLQDSSRLERINIELERFRGAEQIQDESIKADIKKIDAALKIPSAEQNTNIYTYKHLTSQELGYAIDSFYENESNKIDIEQYAQFKNDFKYGSISDFMKVNLTQHPGDRLQPVLLHLKIPKGKSLGYLKENEVIIERDQGIEINESSLIIVKGRQVIKVEAELIPTDDVLEKLAEKETLINDEYKTETGYSGKLVSFVLDGFYSSIVANRAEILIDLLKNNIPRDVLKKCIEKMDEDGAIMFVDIDMTVQGKHPDTMGAYDAEEKLLWLRINHPGHIDQKDEDRNTLFHEFGHAIDNLIFEDISKQEEFEKIYEKEKDNITIEEYIKINSEEFFAGVFGYLYSPNLKEKQQIQREAPEACEFIEEKMDSVKKR
ncbi:anthrax toxin lethal factor-related metalloendopeptidase [Bacillus mycoides]|uniref:anthrax toxin lethal factor-related metalloendopeptidase n=1 Tax=Bacillus mycoides TaxID=1405 RepID=UPI003D65AB63